MFLITLGVLIAVAATGIYLVLRPKDGGVKSGPENNWANEDYLTHEKEGKLRSAKFTAPPENASGGDH
jgi:hypothetical protein